METRKIMALGKSSLVVSLPKDWLNINNLERGDTVSLETQRDLSLVVHPNLKTGEKEKKKIVVIEPDEDEEAITRIVIGCYLNGYSTIQLTSKKIFTTKQQKAIRDVVKSLYLRIIESHASEVVLQTLMDESMASVEHGIDRMHLITVSMCRDILIAMETWDNGLANSVISLEDDVDQFMFYLMRLIRCAAINPSLAGQLGLDILDCLDYQTLVDRIERIADHTTMIAQSVAELTEHENVIPLEVWNVFIESAKLSFDSYEKAVQYFLSKTVSDSNRIIDRQQRVVKLLRKVTPLPDLGTESRAVFLQMFSIRENIRRISEYAADIAEITIDRTFKPEDS
ncbi:phosphate uptake regulator PhoU [Candidatus Bathyarchaeota archaeon]|nr:phosphate uptake regulator PhoU [Candidatus Bathyarchaeota archaeon]